MNFLPLQSFSNVQYIRAEKTKPNKYPPVVLKIIPIPPLNPENTGKPMAPSSMYTIVVKVPSLPPRKPKVKNTAKVCNVMGISPMGAYGY